MEATLDVKKKKPQTFFNKTLKNFLQNKFSLISRNFPKNNVSIFQIPTLFRKAQGYDLRHRVMVLYRGGKLKVYELRTMLNIKIAF